MGCSSAQDRIEVRLDYLLGLSVNDYDYADEEILNSGETKWMRAPDFRQTLKAVHLITDIVPYWCQIFQLISMAIERYILICKGGEYEKLLNKWRRKLFYALTIILSFLVPALLFAEHDHQEIDTVSFC